MPIKVEDSRDIDSAYDQAMTPGALHDAETKHEGSHDTKPDYERGDDTHDKHGPEPEDSNAMVNNAEENTSPSYINNYTGASTSSAKNTIKNLIIKRGAPTAAIGGILVTIGIGASMLLSPSMLFIHMKELIVDKFNIQSTTLEVRSQKLLNKKMTSTTASCSKITMRCKYNRLSDKMLKRMADQGMVAYKNGKPIELKDGWGTQRPDEFRPKEGSDFKPPNGKQGVNAKEFGQFLKENPTAAGVYRRAYNPHWTSFWDSTYNKFLGRIGFGAKNSKIAGKTEEDVKKSVKENMDGKSLKTPGVSTSGKADEDEKNGKKFTEANNAASSEANALIEDGNTKTVADLQKEISGKLRGGATLAVNLYCMARGSDDLAKAFRAIQMAQMIGLGLMFMQVADEVKLGHGDPAKIATIGSMFTASLISASGTTVKRSAMEADGMGYAMNGNTAMTSKTSDYTRWIPGGGFIQTLSKIGNMLKSGNPQADGAMKQACDVMGSWQGQLAGLALNFTPVGAILAIAGIAITESPPFQELMASLFKSIAGKMVDSSTLYEDLGNAASIGMVQAMSEGGNAGGTMPLSVDQAVAYSSLTTSVRLANAKIDRATLSPLDASSPNTFMGSIVTKFMPYYGAVQAGPIGTVGAVTNVVGSTFASLFTPRAFANSTLSAETLKNSCPDTSITSEGIAAGPLCDVQYGIPPQWMDIDPSENLESLISQGQLDGESETGEPIAGSKLAEYIEQCAKGDGSTATKECMIDSKEKASYALYNIDRRIQRNMDGEEEYTGDVATEGSATVPEATVPGEVVDTPNKNGWSAPIQNGGRVSLKWHEMGSKGLHKGIDFPAPKGTQVTAAHDGTVSRVRDMGSCGWATVITADGVNGIWHAYQHADPTVKEGDKVKRGQVIATVGRFCGSGTHLHFSIETANRVSAYADSGASDTSRNPADWIPMP